MKNLLLYVRYIALSSCLFLCSGIPSAMAQSIRLLRTDALPARSGFVTARLPFSVDVIVENVQGCTAVSFDLIYNNMDNISFSGWERATPALLPNVSVVSRVLDAAGNVGVLTIGAILPQSPANSNGVSASTFAVVRLNFSVNNNAFHGALINMRFSNPEAVIVAGNGTSIRLASQSSNYLIRGVVTVWPGDTDNNGIVDSRDFNLFSRFYDAGTASSQDPVAPGVVRGFPRNPPSTVWAAQRTIAWDSIPATYVDADGDGVVGVSDILVWLANLGKIRLSLGKNDDTDIPTPPAVATTVAALQKTVQGSVRLGEIQQTGSRLRIPLDIRSTQRGLGVALRMSWSDIASRYRVVSIDQGTLFGQNPATFTYFMRDNDTGADIVIGNANPTPDVLLNGTLAFLTVEPIGASPPRFAATYSNMRGIGSDGVMFTIQGIINSIGANKSIAQNALTIAPNPAEHRMTMRVPKQVQGIVKMYDMKGKIVMAHSINQPLLAGDEMMFDISALAPGTYILALDTGAEILTAQFAVVR